LLRRRDDKSNLNHYPVRLLPDTPSPRKGTFARFASAGEKEYGGDKGWFLAGTERVTVIPFPGEEVTRGGRVVKNNILHFSPPTAHWILASFGRWREL